MVRDVSFIYRFYFVTEISSDSHTHINTHTHTHEHTLQLVKSKSAAHWHLGSGNGVATIQRVCGAASRVRAMWIGAAQANLGYGGGGGVLFGGGVGEKTNPLCGGGRSRFKAAETAMGGQTGKHRHTATPTLYA
jgi:hypothetical protein